MNSDSFKSKIIFSIIDKAIIGFIAAMLIFFFQQQQLSGSQENQRMIEACQSVSKIYTSILLKQREDIIKTMGDYFLLIEKIKEECKPIEPNQVDALMDFIYKMRFNIKSIQDMNPEATSKKINSTKKEELNIELKNVSRQFEQSIADLNSSILSSARKKECLSDKVMQSKVDKIMSNYQQFLEKVRDLTIKTIQDEIKIAVKS
jgi:hypothetical protein